MQLLQQPRQNLFDVLFYYLKISVFRSLLLYNNKYIEPPTTNITPRTPKNKSFAKKYETIEISLDNLCVNDAVFNLFDA
jgi:hypothetical protein